MTKERPGLWRRALPSTRGHMEPVIGTDKFPGRSDFHGEVIRARLADGPLHGWRKSLSDAIRAAGEVEQRTGKAGGNAGVCRDKCRTANLDVPPFTFPTENA